MFELLGSEYLTTLKVPQVFLFVQHGQTRMDALNIILLRCEMATNVNNDTIHTQIEAMQHKAVELQEKVKSELWSNMRTTKYVRSYGANNIEDLPVVAYDDIKPFIEQMMKGERDVLWPGTVDW